MEEKKNNLIQNFCHNLMLESGKKFRASLDKKKIIILTLVLSEKKILNETKNHNHPLQVKWSVPKEVILSRVCVLLLDVYTRQQSI